MASRKVASVWFSDVGTYPIMAALAGAVGVVAYFGGRFAFAHPEVYFNKEDRKKGERRDTSLANTYNRGGLRHLAERPHGHSLLGFGAINDNFGAQVGLKADRK